MTNNQKEEIPGSNIIGYYVDDLDDPVFRAKVNIAVAKFEKQLAESLQNNSNTQ